MAAAGRAIRRRCCTSFAAHLIDADVSTLGLRFIRRVNVQSGRLPIATIYSAITVLLPFALGAAIVATSIVLVVSYVRPASDGVTYIQDQLLALAPTYSGQIDLVKLTPLLPLANQLAALIPPTERLFRVVFGLWSAFVGIVYVVRAAGHRPSI